MFGHGGHGRRKPRQFNYRPIYYDPEKEARERRRDELLGARPSEGEYVPGSMLRSRIDNRDRKIEMERRARGGRRTRFIVLLLGAGLLIYWIFFT